LNSAPTTIRLLLRCALILGLTGFAAGFFGPMVLNPESNLGPVIGILFSGPGGVLVGAVLGALFGVLSVGETARRQILTIACVVLAVGTLYFCLPKPAVLGYIIDAQVEACELPEQELDVASAAWDAAVARVTWAAPAANWKQTAISSVKNDPGAVLTMRIRRKSAILRHRQPWDRNLTSASAWFAADELKKYYADDEGSDCPRYLARQGQLYWPAIDSNAAAPQPAKVWPPTDTLGFLQLQTLGPVPAKYQGLLH
jgi:hypothetical protein